MRRDLLKKIDEWAKDSHRKPLLLREVRQVGKSWLAKKPVLLKKY